MLWLHLIWFDGGVLLYICIWQDRCTKLCSLQYQSSHKSHSSHGSYIAVFFKLKTGPREVRLTSVLASCGDLGLSSHQNFPIYPLVTFLFLKPSTISMSKNYFMVSVFSRPLLSCWLYLSVQPSINFLLPDTLIFWFSTDNMYFLQCTHDETWQRCSQSASSPFTPHQRPVVFRWKWTQGFDKLWNRPGE